MLSMRLVFCQVEIMINMSSTPTLLEKETESLHFLNIHLKLTRSTQTVFFVCLSRSHWSCGVLVWMNDVSCAKQVMSPALGFFFFVPYNDCRQTPKWKPCRDLYNDLPMPRDAQHPCEGKDQKWVKRVDRIFLSRSAFPGLFDHSIIAWGIRTTNLTCRIIDFQGTCDPYRYSVLLLRPQTIWMEVPSLARSWK